MHNSQNTLANIAPKRSFKIVAIIAAGTALGASLLPSQPVKPQASTNAHAVGSTSGAGAIEGRVTFRGPLPLSPVADDSGVRRQIVEVDEKSKGIRNVVVYLMHTNGSALPATPFSAESSGKALVDQQNYEFSPRVIAVRQGQPVVFSNSDPANHNVRTSASAQKNEFNVFTGVDGKYEHRFVAQPGYRPIRLGCDIHPWMQGWIFVFDHAGFAVTDEQGRFHLPQIAPGEYELHVVQPDLKHQHHQNIRVTAKETLSIEAVVEAKHPD